MLALSWPRLLSRARRASAFFLRSATSPNAIDPVGHAFAQAVPRPLRIRSSHRVHFLAVPVWWLKATTPNGHDGRQYLHPMQTSCRTTTFPSSVRTIAPVGQALRHPASPQCLQESLEISHRPPARLEGNCSMNRTCRQLVPERSAVLS